LIRRARTVSERIALISNYSGGLVGAGIIAMQRSNWTPVIVPNAPRTEDEKFHEGETTPSAARFDSAITGQDQNNDIPFTITVAIALGLPMLISAALYLVATAALGAN
jgi:hypothetical protein